MANCRCGKKLETEWDILCDEHGGDPPRVEITRFCSVCGYSEERWAWLGDILLMIAEKLGIEDDIWGECIKTEEAVVE